MNGGKNMNKQYAHITFYVVERDTKIRHRKLKKMKEMFVIWIKGIFPLLFLRSYRYERKYEIVTNYGKYR